MNMTLKTARLACGVLLFTVAVNAAGDDLETNGAAAAAALENQALVMEADIERQCQKLARAARALCREQHARAVQRLRERAANKH